LAPAGRADLLVSADRDLPDLSALEGIAIVTPAEACVDLGI